MVKPSPNDPKTVPFGYIINPREIKLQLKPNPAFLTQAIFDPSEKKKKKKA